ncbi:hypothetical protein D3C75_507980 [compost metagenome]
MEADSFNHTDGFVAGPLMPLEHGDFAEAPADLQLTVLNRQLNDQLLRLHMVLNDLDYPGSQAARLYRSMDDEILRHRQLLQMNRGAYFPGIGIDRKLRRHNAVLSHHYTGCNGRHYVNISQIPLQQNNIRAGARRNRTDITGHPEAFGSVNRRHLEGGNRLETLGNRMSYDKIHMSLIPQRLRAPVIGNEHHPARVKPVLCMRSNRLGYIMPGGAAAHFGVHSQPHPFDNILCRYTFMVTCNARSSIDRKPPVAGWPGEVPVNISSGAQRRLDFTDHFVIPVDNTREIHHLTEGNNIFSPGVGLCYLSRSQRSAGCFEFSTCRRYTRRYLHVGCKRRAAHLIQHQLNALQPEYIGNFVCIKEPAGRAQRQHCPGKFRHRQLCTLNMAVAVKQSGSDVFACRFDNPGIPADCM